MRWNKTLQIIGAHCEGEIGKVITGGVINIPGKTMLDKMNYINEVDDSIRRFVTMEPRGCLQMSVNLLLPPTRPDAHAGFLVLQSDKAHPMSGSNAICVVTALLELGMIPMQEPITEVVLDMPAGLVTAYATCLNGRCISVSLDMPPSFVEALDIVIDTEYFGPIRADIAFGGVYYALVDIDQLGLTIEPKNARKLAELGVGILNLVNNQFKVKHELYPEIDRVAYTMFRNLENFPLIQTCTTLPPGRVDRSPCGTGSSANLASLAARKLAEVGCEFVSQSIIGSEFNVHYLGNTLIGNKPAILPRVKGRAWIYSVEQVGLDPDDPMAVGFMLSDTWGEGL